MNQIKVNYTYEVLLALLKTEMHGRELAKELKTSLTRIQAVLNELRDSNVLDYKTEGRNHVYFIKKNLVSRSFILNAENYKLIKLLRKHGFLEPIFIDITTKYPNETIILFGSYAKGIPREDSDIDIYVDTTNLKIKEDIKNIYHLINVKIGKFNPNDLLIKEIVRNHVVIQGGESFYERLGIFK
jgi:predicted nucleotidyltransferase